MFGIKMDLGSNGGNLDGLVLVRSLILVIFIREWIFIMGIYMIYLGGLISSRDLFLQFLDLKSGGFNFLVCSILSGKLNGEFIGNSIKVSKNIIGLLRGVLVGVMRIVLSFVY